MPRNPYKKIDKFLDSKLHIKMLAATTWRDFLHIYMLDLAKRGVPNPEYNFKGISWKVHLADGMYIDGRIPVISKKTGKVLEKPFARYFEQVLDRIFYGDESKKLAHFQRLFEELRADIADENRQFDRILDIAWDNRKSFKNDEVTRKVVEVEKQSWPK